jgi:hypothetical protein
LAASTWYHLYGYLNAGTPAIELSTTAPAAAYNGTARSKTGDTSRRYLGSIKTDSGSSITNFSQIQNKVCYYIDVAGGATPARILLAGVATSYTNVSASILAPITSKIAQFKFQNLDTMAAARISNSDASLTLPAGLFSMPSNNNAPIFAEVPMDGAQNIQYGMASTPSGAGLYIDIVGYTYER